MANNYKKSVNGPKSLLSSANASTCAGETTRVLSKPPAIQCLIKIPESFSEKLQNFVFIIIYCKIESTVEVPYRCHCPYPCISCPCANPFSIVNMNIQPGAGITESDNIQGYGGKIMMPFYCLGKGRIKCASFGSFNIQDNMDNTLVF